MNFSILQNRIFLFAYMGIFWSEATTVFSIKSCHMTRVLKTVSGRNFAHFQQISSGRKNAEFHLFSSGWKFWPAFALAHREMERSPEQNKIFFEIMLTF